jgi:hypothetical protein
MKPPCAPRHRCRAMMIYCYRAFFTKFWCQHLATPQHDSRIHSSPSLLMNYAPRSWTLTAGGSWETSTFVKFCFKQAEVACLCPGCGLCPGQYQTVKEEGHIKKNKLRYCDGVWSFARQRLSKNLFPLQRMLTKAFPWQHNRTEELLTWWLRSRLRGRYKRVWFVHSGQLEISDRFIRQMSFRRSSVCQLL